MNLKNLLLPSYFSDPMLIIRIWLGIAFLIHGLPGIFNSDYMDGVIGFMQVIDIPMPEIMAYLSKSGELICGILLVIGLFTRFAAAFIFFDMLVATFFALNGDIFGDFQGETSFTYLILAVAIFLNGATSFSLDKKLFSKD